MLFISILVIISNSLINYPLTITNLEFTITLTLTTTMIIIMNLQLY